MAGPSIDFIRQLRDLGVVDAKFCRARVVEVRFAEGRASIPELQATLANLDPKAAARLEMQEREREAKRQKQEKAWAEQSLDWSSGE